MPELFRSEEQNQFFQIVSRHMETMDAPLLLEGGTGLGKTRAYLAAIAAASNKRMAIVLPTNQLVDQVLMSADLQAVGLSVFSFRRSDMFESRVDYEEAKRHAKESRVMICTATSVMIDQRLRGEYNGVIDRDYLIFDEADQLPQFAALFRDLSITAAELDAAGIALEDTNETLTRLAAKKTVAAEVRAKALIILEAINAPSWYMQKAGKDDDDGISLIHRLPGRLLKKISNRPSSCFISASLSVGDSFRDFRTSMGIESESRLSTTIEPARHGSLSIYTETEASVVDVISDAAKPCLVATSSHDLAEKIGKLLPGAVVRARTETTSEAASRLPNDGVLVAAGAWAGLDTPIRWASIVIPKIPFEPPDILDDHIESRYIDSRNAAIRKMKQVLGRGLRTPDAVCDVYILDERVKQLGNFAPKRFAGSWHEGSLEKKFIEEAKRLRSYRPKILKKYGNRCQACGLVPPSTQMLDVHHLYPIAKGERVTTEDDLTLLCANHHRLAHTKKPEPMSVEELKKTLKAAL